MTTKQVADKLQVSDKYIRKYKSVFRYHQSYFWGPAKNEHELAVKVGKIFPNATIIGVGNHYHDFVGGAESGSAKDSFIWVKFKLSDSKS